jgi:hypothetical protein
MSDLHKDIIEQFIQTVNGRHVNHLEKVLDENVEKYSDSKILYKNIQEAREYYSMEHEANLSAQWKILDYQIHNLNNNTIQATLSYNNHKYNTIYTFNSSGKIQKIDSHLQQQQQQ